MGTREESKNHRRDKIIAAARQLLEQSGEPGFSMRALAQQAGVSIATPYNLFGSKQAVMLSVWESDFGQYQQKIEQLRVDELELFFDAVSTTAERLNSEPVFYRTFFNQIRNDEHEAESTPAFLGTRYAHWKKLVKNAIRAGLLVPDTEADAFAMNLRHQFLDSIYKWVDEGLDLLEMEATIHYGFALSLAAMATEQSRQRLQKKIRQAQWQLQSVWQTRLQVMINAGELDVVLQQVAADQIKIIRESPQQQWQSTLEA